MNARAGAQDRNLTVITHKRKIEVASGHSVSAVWAVPEAWEPGRDVAILLAHGAGADMQHPFMCFVHEAFAARSLLSVKFNFPYKERGARAPDRPPLLEATWRTVLAAVREDKALSPARVVLAGKSMGGRIATHLAAQGEACDGLVLLGYPLHPARQPERLRAAHLRDITVPVLFVQGTRDALCDLELLRPVLREMPGPVELHPIDGGDHSFAVPKRSGRDQSEILDGIVDEVIAWMSRAGITEPSG